MEMPSSAAAFAASAAPAAVHFRCDWHTGASWYSPTYRALIGPGKSGEPGEPEWVDTIHPADRTRVLCLRVALEIGECDCGQVEYRVLHANGGCCRICAEVRVERRPDARPRCLVGRILPA